MTSDQQELLTQLEKVILETLRPSLQRFVEHDLHEKKLSRIEEAAPSITRFRHLDGNLFAEIKKGVWDTKFEVNLPARSREALFMNTSYRLREASEILHYEPD